MEKIIQEFLMPVVLIGCYALGMALKSTKRFPDELIPITLLIVGAVIAPLVMNKFDAATVVMGAVSGWAAVGLNQSIKQIGKVEE